MAEENTTEGRKILIVDDAVFIRSTVGKIFTDAGYRIIEAENGEQALLMAGQFEPDLIVMDVNMPVKNGIEALTALRGDMRYDHTAIVMLTSEQDPETVRSAVIAGASDYILKDNTVNIKQRLQPYLQLLANPARGEKCVLVVDDTRLMRRLVSDIFTLGGHRVIEAENGKIGLLAAAKSPPDLIVMDVNMPVFNGIQALKVIRSNNRLKDIPVIMLTSETDGQKVQEILAAGVSDYIVKENADEIKSRLQNYLRLM